MLRHTIIRFRAGIAKQMLKNIRVPYLFVYKVTVHPLCSGGVVVIFCG